MNKSSSSSKNHVFTRFIKIFVALLLVTTFVFSSATPAFAKKAKKKTRKPKGHIILLTTFPSNIFATDSFRIKPKLKVKVKKGVYRYGKVRFTYKSSNRRVATVNSKGVVTGVSKGNVTITIKSSNGVKRKFPLRVKGIDKLVALTFDDGPSIHTPRLLEAMHDNGFHGTFFMVGTFVQGNQGTLKKMLKYRNELGIHGWNHPYYSKMSQAEVASDIDRTRNLICSYTGVSPNLVRPPYGSHNATTLAAFSQMGCSCCMWNTDIEDWKYFNAAVVENNILNRVHPGAVLVIHDSHSWSVDAIISAMPKLKAQGYELCTVSDFCRLKGINLSPGSSFYGTDN